MDNVSETSHSSPEATHQPQGQGRRTSKTDRPCDTCRKRKSRCVREAGHQKCVLCTFHHRDCTYLDEPQKRKRKRADAGGDADCGIQQDDYPSVAGKKPNSTPVIDTSIPINGSGRSLLDRTLGLHRTTHSKYIGASSLHDAQLLDLLSPSYQSCDGEPQSKFRRADSSTMFVNRQDSHTLFHSDDEVDLEVIEQIVRPHGPALVQLYFRIVHPSYPVLHKGVFLEKYARTYKEFSPPLLAAVYLLAMDWWEYDRDLSSKEPPDGAKLIKAATKTLTSVIHRPKLSTVQAGLLLLQRSGGDSWPLTCQIVAVGQDLGLHLNCSSWNIPDWERGLRRRLKCALYMQNTWGALIHGRPSHISQANRQTGPLTLEDFPESAADEDDKEGSTEVEKGRYLFMHLTKLTDITAEVLDVFYSLDQSRTQHLLATAGMPGLLELVKPIAMKLKEWASSMPAGLRMEDVKTRKLCSNGYLHLSYFAVEIVVHRYIIRSLLPDTPQQLRSLCRQAARSRLDHAMTFVESLRPEHLQGFWWFASSKCLALIGSYGALLWATSTDEEEAEVYRQKLDDFRWSLKVRAKGSSFLSAAIRELDDALEGLDFRQSPVMPLASASATLTQSTPQDASALVEGSPQQVLSHHYTQDEFGNLSNLGATPNFDLLNYDSVVSQSLFADLDLGLHFPVMDQT